MADNRTDFLIDRGYTLHEHMNGFANLIIPTSGVLMAKLSIAKIPYQKWLHFIFPLFLQLILLSTLFLAIAVMIGY